MAICRCTSEKEICHAYKYADEELDTVANLYIMGGHVKFHLLRNGSCTDWHGSAVFAFNRMRLRLRFQEAGETGRLRLTKMHCIGPGTYVGRDYRHGLIKMEYRTTFWYCRQCDLWDEVLN